MFLLYAKTYSSIMTTVVHINYGIGSCTKLYTLNYYQYAHNCGKHNCVTIPVNNGFKSVAKYINFALLMQYAYILQLLHAVYNDDVYIIYTMAVGTFKGIDTYAHNNATVIEFIFHWTYYS